MQLPQEVVDNIFSNMPAVSLNDLKNFLKVGKTWYEASKKSYYKTLNINDNVNVDLLLKCMEQYDIKYYVVNVNISNRSATNMIAIAEEENSFVLFDKCENIKKIEVKNVNPYYILNSIRRAKLPQIEEIRLNWSSLSNSQGVIQRFFAANYRHKDSINTLSLPFNRKNQHITFDFDGKKYDFIEEDYVKEFNITYYHRSDVLEPINLTQ